MKMTLEDAMCCLDRIGAIHAAGSNFIHKERIHVLWVDIGQGQVVRNKSVREWRKATNGCTMNKIMDKIRERVK